ncbi:glutaredoxin family protein [Candidatus Methylacidiphilum fumarolicum]|uniref:Glutaredoxin n=2 Tax=Candidatus Methylacidiphilum fumarolicum TaxID=591154 RepID=I0JWV3_METFB|nr:glutaredoxin family protein [Candidatus Methylacidiphilum fumarolicum]MBW6414417.1 glutaredoxin family protein [Candidatus Methylacidiphilum fumarolicum]TFE69420.1 NrdH-redoxin [Candidatus Methylacidiphilum fumarolicum]TFE72874.1 glutaredoxin family protein [Candidatus Methylacidiphilum fumarolicum]TFE74617.1 glutaredoxin family protein [Candidatus Methylacidiphilum fumarolicum]TFE77184.1 NrdH-redoxin [Candidatus Methylacidiphilum fumarolicum]
MKEAKIILYVKEGCPWCEEAEDLLKKFGITYQRIDVLKDKASYQRMVKISGQSRAPTLEWEDDVLADFGGKELLDFFHKKRIKDTTGKHR